VRGRALGGLVVLLLVPPLGAQSGAPASATSELEAIEAMIERGQLAEAERELRSVADRFDSVRALLRLARLQAGRQDLDGTLESLEQARVIAPNSEEVLSGLAGTLLAAGSVLPAIEILDALTRMCPTVAKYHYLEGEALLQAGDAAAAVESLSEAARLGPGDVPTLIALGVALNRRRQYPEARQSLLEALSLAPESVEAAAALAEAEEGLGDLEAAEGHALRALARAQGNARANMVLGMVRMGQERYPEARDALVTAVARDPDSAKAHYQLSLVYARLDDETRAQEHLQLYRQKKQETEERVDEVRKVTGFSLGGMLR
jgi:tetratricopeptide (TPR) repeat protein